MRETEPNRRGAGSRQLTHSISAKLIGSLLAVMVVVFAVQGYLNIQLHRQHLEMATLSSAERVGNIIKNSATYYMLRNDRDGLYHAIRTIADEPGVTKVRILELRPENAIISNSRSLYKRIPFTLRATGTYAQTAAFLYAIETGPRLTYIPTLMYRRVELETANPAVILEMNVQMLGKK